MKLFKVKNLCLLKLERSTYEPSIPCMSSKKQSVPKISTDAPNCFVGGWSVGAGGTWELSTAPVQQIFHEPCSIGLQTIIEPSEICLVGIGMVGKR